jgi:hypothetical protein
MPLKIVYSGCCAFGSSRTPGLWVYICTAATTGPVNQAVCCVAWAILHTILKETKRAVAKVKQHTNSIALLVVLIAACLIIVMLAVDTQGFPIPACMNQPLVEPCGIKVGPADADEDAQHQQI